MRPGRHAPKEASRGGHGTVPFQWGAMSSKRPRASQSPYLQGRQCCGWVSDLTLRRSVEVITQQKRRGKNVSTETRKKKTSYRPEDHLKQRRKEWTVYIYYRTQDPSGVPRRLPTASTDPQEVLPCTCPAILVHLWQVETWTQNFRECRERLLEYPPSHQFYLPS